MQTVREIMCSDVQSASPDQSLVELENMLLNHNVGGLPVVDLGQLVGMVSRSDIVRHLRLERDLALSDIELFPEVELTPDDELDVSGIVSERLERIKVRDVMNRKTDSIQPDRPISEAAALLISKHIHRLPVLDRGELVGIVSSLDIVKLVADSSQRSPDTSVHSPHPVLTRN